MIHPYTEELVSIESEDGLPLEGAVIRPASAVTRPLALVWVHGLASKFYGRTTIPLGHSLADHGYTFVTGNNRGHDFGTVYVRKNGERLLAGGGWELFSDCPLDIGSWVSFAIARGFRGVALIGHSLGALKVAYYQSQRQDPRVVGLVAASPPARNRQPDPALSALAEQMVSDGRGRDLLPWDISPAGGGTWSARAYHNRVRTNTDVYGTFTPDPAVASVTCPILALYGSDEAWVGSEADLQTIVQNARLAPRVETRMIPGADHSYTGHEAEVAACIAAWADTLSPPE